MTTRRVNARNQGRTQDDAVVSLRVPRQPTLRQVERIQNVGNITQPAADGGGTYSFALSNLPSSSEFTALFQQYRIDRVDLIWTYTSQDLTAGAANRTPILYIAPLYTEAVVPAALTDVFQYNKCAVIAFDQGKRQHIRSMRPKPQISTGNSGVMIPTTTPWLSTTVPGVVHYGAVYWIQNYNSTSFSSNTITLSVRYVLSFKGIE